MRSDQHLRVSDAERQAVTDRLAEHFAAGRLDPAEFDDRVGRAMSAKTRADLSGLFANLSETGAPAVPELPRGGGSTPRLGQPGPGSPIEFRLDPPSGVPTYLQLVHQVEHALRLGYLQPGDQLPKVRDLVASLAINPNTVLKAYKELETKGLAAGRPGQGTFIQAALSRVALPELTALHRSLTGWLTAADGAGLDEDGIVALFTSALRDFYERRGDPDGRRGAAGGRRGMNVVEASGLGRRYGGTSAPREYMLAIPAGYVAALAGPNGAGKTTLLNLAAGADDPR